MTIPIGRVGRHVYIATIFAGSFLLFLVQPMIARMALPRLGGAPAVWNSAMLVYQALLLGGYAYAHALGRLSPRWQAAIHVGVLLVAAMWLPIGLTGAELPSGAQPALWVPWLLGLSIGPLFFAVSAQAPLIQRWFALASGGEDPYRLYAASNLGSFAGLLAYPLVVEPGFALHAQSIGWSAGYLALTALVLVCTMRLPRAAHAEAMVTPSPLPAPHQVLHWIGLALVPSGLMLATSTYITTDIVAMPLLWVLPLGLYLLSFTIAFAARRDIADLLTRVAPITILLFGGVMMGGYQEKPFLNAGLALALLFMVSVALHTAMFRRRPAADRLTGFYLAMAVGGALGGVFAGLVAPVVFDWTYEYPLLILAAGMLVPQAYLAAGIAAIWRDPVRATIATAMMATAILIVVALRLWGPADLFGEERQGFAFIVLAGIGLASVGTRWRYVAILTAALLLFGGYRSIALSLEGGARTRSYFGVYTVQAQPDQRVLIHGTTVHGVQLTGTPERERTPTTYYAPQSGVGRALTLAPALYGPHARIGIVGLGTGTLACYARTGQDWRFYEIDPAILRIARDTGQFSYLSRCLPRRSIAIGDARLSLTQEPTASRDVLALDAFSSDSVPMHLLTKEAFATYARVLAPRGLLLIHISNRFVDLEPVVAAASIANGWKARRLSYRPAEPTTGASASLWIAMTRDPRVIAALDTRDPAWQPLRSRPGFQAWSDDYASVLPLLKGF